MSNIYLEKLAGFGNMGKTLGKVVGVLKGDNIAAAKAVQVKAALKLTDKINVRSKRFQDHMNAGNELAGVKTYNKGLLGPPEDITPYQTAFDKTKRPYESVDKSYTKMKSIASGKSVEAERFRTGKYRMNALAGTAVGLAGTATLMTREKKAEMNNKYLEKIAALTGIELAAAGVLGGYAADKGDSKGGAVAGMAGGALGYNLGTRAAPYLGVAAAHANNMLKKHKGSISQHMDSLNKGVKVARGARAVMAVGGAYGAAKAYSAFKHRNDK